MQCNALRCVAGMSMPYVQEAEALKAPHVRVCVCDVTSPGFDSGRQ